MRPFALVLLTLFTLLGSPARAAEPISVVASFSILGDLTGRIGGTRVRVHTLVGPDGDAHVFQPTPTDAKALARAQLVVVNGLGFEGWISRLVKSAGYRGPVVTASQGVATLKSASAHAHEHGHQHAAEVDADPHAWQDLANARKYVANIAAALIQVDPAGAPW